MHYSFLTTNLKTTSKYLTRLGLSLYENRYNNEAAQVFERALKLEEKDPSQVFYLISIYVEENKYNEIPRLLEFAMNEFRTLLGYKKK